MSAVSMARSDITCGWSIRDLAKKIDCRHCVSSNILSTRKLTVAQGLLFELSPQHLGSDFGIQDLGKGFELPDGRSDEHHIFVFASHQQQLAMIDSRLGGRCPCIVLDSRRNTNSLDNADSYHAVSDACHVSSPLQISCLQSPLPHPMLLAPDPSRSVFRIA